ncbi:MAG: hypothetical protein C0475_05355 [Planctomyces sp.]|nr:hypothetical protein [Planctomyces sp.]
MSPARSVASRWASASRTTRLAVAGGGALIVYLAAVEPVLQLTEDLRQRAAALSGQVARAGREAGQIAAAAAQTQRAADAYGSWKPFSTEVDPVAVLERRLVAVRAASGVSERARRRGTDRPLTLAGVRWTGAQPSFMSPTTPIQRLSIAWDVEGDTAAIVKAVTALEAAPDVHAVQSVTLSRASDGPRPRGTAAAEALLAATIIVEIWAAPPSTAPTPTPAPAPSPPRAAAPTPSPTPPAPSDPATPPANPAPPVPPTPAAPAESPESTTPAALGSASLLRAVWPAHPIDGVTA